MAFQFRDLMMNVVPGEIHPWELTCGPISADGTRREEPIQYPDDNRKVPPGAPPDCRNSLPLPPDRPSKANELHLGHLAALQEQLRVALRREV